MPVFLDHLIPTFYESVGSGYRDRIVRGQLASVPVGYIRENRELWRPTGLDGSKTSAKEFAITPAGGDAFNRKTPLHDPKLTVHEEFLVVRAKRRPVIVLGPIAPAITVPSVRGGGRVNRNLVVVVPVFSLVHAASGLARFHEAFISNLRRLAYPEFLYMPERSGAMKRQSFARVRELHPAYALHLDLLDAKLASEPLTLLQEQLTYLLCGTYGSVLEAYREQLMNQ